MSRNHVVSWRHHGAALSGCEESLGPRTISLMPSTDSLGLVSFMVLVASSSVHTRDKCLVASILSF